MQRHTFSATWKPGVNSGAPWSSSQNWGSRGEAGSWHPDLLFPPQPSPAPQGLWTPMWTLQPISPSSALPIYPKWPPLSCPLAYWCSHQRYSLPLGGQTQMGLETFDRKLLGPRLWSRRNNIGSGWSRIKLRPSKVWDPRHAPLSPHPDISVVLASI